MAIDETSKPALAVGCRWGGSQEDPMLLFPEGAMKVQGTGFAILELCDGQRTLSEIVGELHRRYLGSDAQRIREDAAKFLEQLHEKRIVDY
ncbi:MAG: pyrroloquinoline quinone biosynthesis peptide chaperone PqqD [Acidobacteriia bacterium]|nr:pyrroloquinoline quinone biosynthesis peptide chaperone PqqD [Terriglobia bacterium]